MKELLRRLIISDFLFKKKPSHIVAYMGVLTAMSVLANTLLEYKFFDVQFSLTITISAFIGYVSGPFSGFIICVIGDLIGYIAHPGNGIYMFWVGLSTGSFALIAGLLAMDKSDKPLFAYLKVAIFCVLSFLICTAGINSLGFYFYNMNVGFSDAVRKYVAESLGGEQVTFLGYLAYRLIFKLQILNSVFNYVMVFMGFTAMKTIPPLKKLLEA